MISEDLVQSEDEDGIPVFKAKVDLGKMVGAGRAVIQGAGKIRIQ